MAEGEPARRRAVRWRHLLPLAVLLGLGLGPFFLLFPNLPGGPAYDPSVRPVALWLGTALLGGLAGTRDGAARPLYRAAGIAVAATLLSPLALRVILRSDLLFPLGLATRLGLDGEAALDAALYEAWLAAWLAVWLAIWTAALLACPGVALLGRHLFRRNTPPAARAARGGASIPPPD